MNTAPISAHSTVDIEINNSCNWCCCRPSRKQIRARKQKAHTAKLNEIRDRELAAYRKEIEAEAYKPSVQKAETTHKADGVVKEVLGYKVAE